MRVRNSQASKDTSSKYQRNGNAQVDPETRIFRRLGKFLFGERVDDAAKRDGLDQGCKGVEDADKEHVDAPGLRAIDAAHGGARGANGGGHSKV